MTGAHAPHVTRSVIQCSDVQDQAVQIAINAPTISYQEYAPQLMGQLTAAHLIHVWSRVRDFTITT